MRAKAIGSLLTAAAVAVLLLPTAGMAHGNSAGRKPAGRTPATRTVRPEAGEDFTLRGTNGFDIDVNLHDRHLLTVSATSTAGEGTASVEYKLRAPQRRGSDDIVARLGRLGRIDVRFVPASVRKEPPPRRCHGGDIVIEKGHFVGFVAFRGEHGYTRVRAHRVAGLVGRKPTLICRRPARQPGETKAEREASKRAKEKGEKEDDLQLVELAATARGHRITFRAGRVSAQLPGEEKLSITTFSASGGRQRGRIHEQSLAFDILEKGSTFLSPEPLLPTREAVLKPPAPFSGTATFRRNSTTSVSWTGNLKVDLPGFGVVPLAGHGTSAEMCEGLSCGIRSSASARRLLRPRD